MIHFPKITCFRCRTCGQCIACERHADRCKFAAKAMSAPADMPIAAAPTTALGAMIGGAR